MDKALTSVDESLANPLRAAIQANVENIKLNQDCIDQDLMPFCQTVERLIEEEQNKQVAMRFELSPAQQRYLKKNFQEQMKLINLAKQNANTRMA